MWRPHAGARNKAPQPRHAGEGCVYSLRRWCAEADVSPSKVYQLWKEGRGPRFIKFDGWRYVIESPRSYLERAVAEGQAKIGGGRGVEARKAPAAPQWDAASHADASGGSSTRTELPHQPREGGRGGRRMLRAGKLGFAHVFFPLWLIGTDRQAGAPRARRFALNLPESQSRIHPCALARTGLLLERIEWSQSNRGALSRRR